MSRLHFMVKDEPVIERVLENMRRADALARGAAVKEIKGDIAGAEVDWMAAQKLAGRPLDRAERMLVAITPCGVYRRMSLLT